MTETATNALFKIKAVKIDTLGDYLRQVRKTLNLDLKTVSLLTQIKPSYLELLEAGDYHKLPADVYIRGFLKSLANFYHVQEQILIDQYEKERGFETATAISKFQLPSNFNLTPRTIIISTSLLVAMLAIGYIVYEIRSVLVPPYLSVNEPSSDTTIDGNSILVAGRGEIGGEVFINNQPVLIDQQGQFNETLLLSPGLNVVEITEKNKFNKVSKITRQITSKASEETAPPVNAAVELTVNIGPNSAWVNIEADGVVVERGTMLAGSSKTVSAKNEIVLTSANAGSTKIIYNGKDLGVMGREGEVLRNVQFSTPTQ